MKALLFLFSMLSLGISAQNQRYIYEYKLIKDSTNKEDVRSEMMYLDTSKEGSRYYSYTAFHSDSLMRADLEKQLKATGQIQMKSDMKKEAVRYSVSKDYPDYRTYLHNRIGTDNYKVLEERKQNWKISPEKEKIGNWQAQKATLDFAGRQWTAWFTTEIPVQDGPYKFAGLPGLIVKIEDKTGSHILELRGIRKIDELGETNAFKAKNEISINTKQYEKVMKEYQNDPTKGLKQLTMGNVVMKPAEGSDTKWIREREEKIKQDLKKDNNKIELSLN